MPPSHDWLAVLAGLGATSALAVAVVVLAGVIGFEPRTTVPPLATTPPASGVAAAQAPPAAAGDQMASLKRVHHIAAVQLRRADRELRGCRTAEGIRISAGALASWRDCARWPLAHLRINARVDANILYQISQRVPPGDCRMLAMARSNRMRLLASATDQLVRGWWDASPAGRVDTVSRTLAVARTTGDMRLDLRHPGLRICRPGALDA